MIYTTNVLDFDGYYAVNMGGDHPTLILHKKGKFYSICGCQSENFLLKTLTNCEGASSISKEDAENILKIARVAIYLEESIYNYSCGVRYFIYPRCERWGRPYFEQLKKSCHQWKYGE